eukprot:EG_transcript_11940
MPRRRPPRPPAQPRTPTAATEPTPPPPLLALPLPVLQQHLLPHLTPEEAVALGRCCQALWHRTDDPEFWGKACLARGWSTADRLASRSHYSRQASRRCKHCEQPTPYVFKLLGLRLCERCERQNPRRYALVTATEAVEGFGLDPTLLPRLRKHHDRDLQLDFFLQRDVADLSPPEMPTAGRAAGAAESAPPKAPNPKQLQRQAARQEALEMVLQQRARQETMDAAPDGEGEDEGHRGGRVPTLHPQGSSGSDDQAAAEAAAEGPEDVEKAVQRELARRALEARRAARRREKEARKQAELLSGGKPSTAGQGLVAKKDAKPRPLPDAAAAGAWLGGPSRGGDGERGKPNLKWAKAQRRKTQAGCPAAWRTQLGKAVALGNQAIQEAAVKGGYVMEKGMISQASGQFAVSGLWLAGEATAAPAALPLWGEPPNRTERHISLGKRGKA